MRKFHWSRPVTAAAFVLAACAAGSVAAQTVISAVSGFPKGNYWSKRFEAFVPAVNTAAKGSLRIDYKGGAPAVGSPFTMVQKLQKGIYGMVSTTGAYYTNSVPESDALKLTELSIQELRRNGGFDYIDKIHRAKGLTYLGRNTDYIPFHLYLNKKITKPDLKGLHLRVAPIYTNFFKALGATTQRSNIAQVYTYLENGTVADFGWPINGLLPDWHKVIKYRVDPGFYRGDIHFLMNLQKWNSLSRDQQAIIKAEIAKVESGNDWWKGEITKARAQQDKQGIEVIKFSPADEKFWIAKAKEAGWAGVNRVSPKHGPMLKKFFTKN